MPHVAPYSGAMLAIVARSASESAAMPGPKNSTNFPTTPFLRRISVIVRTTSEAVDHCRVRVGADDGVGIGQNNPAPVGRGCEHDAREVLEVDLVDDARVGRHDGEVAERRLTPAQERVALLVARELDGRVQRERL